MAPPAVQQVLKIAEEMKAEVRNFSNRMSIVKSPALTEAEMVFPVAQQALQIIKELMEEVGKLKDEIAILKKAPPRPKIPPPRSGLEGSKKRQTGKVANSKRSGSEKRHKKASLTIHKEVVLIPTNLPSGSKLKDRKEYVVQDIQISAHNIRYLLERWETPDGKIVSAKIPSNIKGHFGNEVRTLVQYLHHQCRVTQPLIRETLLDWGIDISAGQVNNILIEDLDDFHMEKSEILRMGLKVSKYINVDDTKARHKGKNGFCTHIGNEWFAFLASTGSKNRENFLNLLRCNDSGYIINEDALAYMEKHKLPKTSLALLRESPNKMDFGQRSWERHLNQLAIKKKQHRKIATEGAILGDVLGYIINPDLVVVSDDAGQFNILQHALCWVHAERNIRKVHTPTEELRKCLDEILERIWKFYNKLKTYKKSPDKLMKQALKREFRSIFSTETNNPPMNKALEFALNNESELLLVLERPEIPLHNNGSENDIREYVTRRKASGPTRNELGRMARDTFTSLKKTCRKLGVSFWKYLKDRNARENLVPRLAQLIQSRASP
jgi:hypothetical protein